MEFTRASRGERFSNMEMKRIQYIHYKSTTWQSSLWLWWKYTNRGEVSILINKLQSQFIVKLSSPTIGLNKCIKVEKDYSHLHHANYNQNFLNRSAQSGEYPTVLLYYIYRQFSNPNINTKNYYFSLFNTKICWIPT